MPLSSSIAASKLHSTSLELAQKDAPWSEPMRTSPIRGGDASPRTALDCTTLRPPIEIVSTVSWCSPGDARSPRLTRPSSELTLRHAPSRQNVYTGKGAVELSSRSVASQPTDSVPPIGCNTSTLILGAQSPVVFTLGSTDGAVKPIATGSGGLSTCAENGPMSADWPRILSARSAKLMAS